jgi:hypothetical protein
MGKRNFSKSAFTEDIDSRITQANTKASNERKGSAKRQTQEGIVAELQRMRVALLGSPLDLS